MNKPSKRAYSGAVIGDHCFLKMVTKAIINPQIAPPKINGITACGPLVKNNFQVQIAGINKRININKVLLTVPSIVMA